MAIRVEGNSVHSSEMALDAGELFVVDDIIQLHFEATLQGSSRCYIFGVLPAAEQQVELLVFLCVEQRTDCRIPAGEGEQEAADFFKGIRSKELASSISAAGEEHGEVFRESHREDLVPMDVLNLCVLASVDVVLEKPPLVGAVVNGFVKGAPPDVIDAVVFWAFNLESVLAGAGSLAPLEHVLGVEHSDERLSVLVFVDNHELFVTVRNFNLLGLDSRHLDLGKQISVGYVENLDSFGSGGREEELSVLGHVDALARVIDLEEPKSFEAFGVVHADGFIVTAGEKTVTIEVELDFLDRPGVSGQVNRLHGHYY